MPEAPAIVALKSHTTLYNGVADSIEPQRALIERLAHTYTPRPSLEQVLDQTIHALDSGLIVIESNAGGGVTSTLAYLAWNNPFPCWFAGVAPQGITALAAQAIALHPQPLPLVPPAIASDPAAFARLLADLTATRTYGEQLVLLIDRPLLTTLPPGPFETLLPAAIPPGVIIVYGTTTGAWLPYPPAARITLPMVSEDLTREQARMLSTIGTPTQLLPLILAIAKGNPLAARLTYGMLSARLITVNQVAERANKPGLESVYRLWWDSMPPQAHNLAGALAAIGGTLPPALLPHLLSAYDDVAMRALTQWRHAGMAIHDEHGIAFAHDATVAFVQAHAPAMVAAAHSRLAALALADRDIATPTALPPAPTFASNAPHRYLMANFARHAACGDAAGLALLPVVAQRQWVRLREREANSVLPAAHDIAWEVRHAASGDDLLRLVRSAALAGTLTSLARTIAPEQVEVALQAAVARWGREAGLRQVRAIVDQLPDIHEKGVVLRRLADACHALKLRPQAARLLSQALDIDEHKRPLVWDEQREQVQTALAQAALARHDVATARAIAALITHPERRGAAETTIVRWLLAHDDVTQAATVARAIGHDNLGAWARAEVALALARRGDRDAADGLLNTIDDVETAQVWGQIEVACALAARDETAARTRIAALDSPARRDRGLARLALALAAADKDGDALAVSEEISDITLRVTTLLELRLQLDGLVAMLALEQATRIIGDLPRDERIPLTAQLAAAYATLGHPDKARAHAQQLAEGEERTRALSRVAVAQGRAGDMAAALTLIEELDDDDEYDWAVEELVQLLGEQGQWAEARRLAATMRAPEQQAQTRAALLLLQARTGNPLDALALLRDLQAVPAQYLRASTLLAPLLVAAGATDEALALIEDDLGDDDRSDVPLLQPERRSRYRSLVVAAQARTGDVAGAREHIAAIAYPLDRARAHLAIAEVTATTDPPTARAALGAALTMLLLGRDEAYRLLQHAVPVLATLDDGGLLLDIARALSEVDAL